VRTHKSLLKTGKIPRRPSTFLSRTPGSCQTKAPQSPCIFYHTHRCDGQRTHVFLNFYIQSQPRKASFSESLSGWTQDKLSFTMDDLITWALESGSAVWERSKDAFKFLSGAPSPPLPADTWSTDTRNAEPKEESRGGFMGMFSSLRGPRGTSVESRPEVDGRTFSEGEVHVNFVKNNQGNFVLRYIIVELPYSRARNSVRVFVERAAGVRDNEPVLRWNS